MGLRCLVLSHTFLGPTAGSALAHLLHCCVGLQELYLDSCGLTREVLERHTSLGDALQGELINHHLFYLLLVII